MLTTMQIIRQTIDLTIDLLLASSMALVCLEKIKAFSVLVSHVLCILLPDLEAL